MRLYVVCPSVCDVEVCFSHLLEFFENNFTAKLLKAYALADPNMGDLADATGTPLRLGWNRGGVWSTSKLPNLRNGAR